VSLIIGIFIGHALCFIEICWLRRRRFGITRLDYEIERAKRKRTLDKIRAESDEILSERIN
jgi:hypothetical protein